MSKCTTGHDGEDKIIEVPLGTVVRDEILDHLHLARELPMEGITSEWLLSMVKNDNKKLVRKSELIDEILNSTATVIVTIGAGDIGEMVPKIKSELLLANK